MLRAMCDEFCTEVCDRVSGAVIRGASAHYLLTCGHLEQPMVGHECGLGHGGCAQGRSQVQVRTLTNSTCPHPSPMEISRKGPIDDLSEVTLGLSTCILVGCPDILTFRLAEQVNYKVST